MGSALMVAMPGFQAILRRKWMKKPVCGQSFSEPTPSNIDSKLLAGGVLFGAGWGLGGLCPGPSLVGLVRPSYQLGAFVASMLTAMLLERRFVH